MHPGCDIEQVYLCREPIDFRKSINGLSVLVERELELNPFGSALYVFTNRQRNKIKVQHVRRRFVEAVRVQPKGRQGHADVAVALIGQLYGIERNYKEAKDEARFQARQQLSLPVLAELHAWLTKMLPAVIPNSALGKALSYMHNYWSMLTRYTERGDLPIDNNRCENAICPFVIGRKAWLFSDTPAGANASAVMYSLLQTAKANGQEPYTWLRRVMRDLPAAKTVEKVEALLPWNLHMPDLTSEMAA